jgi:signal transduction histidine kinase
MQAPSPTGNETTLRRKNRVDPAASVATIARRDPHRVAELPEWGPEHQGRWAAWLLARNRRATHIVLYLNIILYPLFGILDYFVAPRSGLWLLWGTRLLVSVVTLAMFRVIRTSFFEKYASQISAAYQTLVSFGISLMTVFLGGLASPYYAGLSLVMLGIGLMFVWPRKVAITTHSLIVASFVLPNWILGRTGDPFTVVSNLFFLFSTAFIAAAGQVVAYRTHRDQVRTQLVIEATTANLERAHEKLQQLDKFKSEFFANITHELKTPLTMILAPLELMLHGDLGAITDAQRTTLQSMLRSGIKLLKLIGDLLDLSKLDESRLRLRIAEHDLVPYLRLLIQQVQSLAQRKSIELTFESNVESCRIFCDLERLERVIVNLLSNACKFTPPQGRVSVTLTDEGAQVRLAVVDTGIGFPPEMAEMLFERFFQVDMAGTRKFGGTGIGLALSRALVLLHGGKIHAKSAGSGGSTFTVELMKGRDHFDPDSIDRRARQEDRVAGSRETDQGVGDWQVEAKSQYRLLAIDEATDQRIVARDPDEQDRPQSVLVVEDTPDVIRMIHLTLRGRFRILAAPGGEKGFELAVRHLPGLVITDLMMPDMDGMELTRRLRADPRTRHIPIVMLTARGDVEDRVAGLEAGVNAYLTKPFSTRELTSTVSALVRIQENTADLALTHSMDSLETIAGGLAHEINNPLNYIKNALDVLQRDYEASLASVRAGGGGHGSEGRPGGMPVRMARMFEVAETGIKRIGATVALMQRYSKEGFTRVVRPLDLFETARDVASMLQVGMATPVIGTSFEGDGTLECVPEEMTQALTNLIQNALDAIRRDGTGWVRVSGRVEDDAIVISVEDNGTGVRPEDRAKLFTPFFTTKEVGVGMGLGLTIVNRVVRSLGGTISVSSEIGSGTQFLVRLPRETHRRSRVEPIDMSESAGL